MAGFPFMTAVFADVVVLAHFYSFHLSLLLKLSNLTGLLLFLLFYLLGKLFAGFDDNFAG